MTVHLTMHKPGVLRVDAGPRDVSQLRTVPGIRADTRADPPHWKVAATLYHGVLLRALFGESLTYDREVAEFFRAERARERQMKNPRTHEAEELIDAYETAINQPV